MIKNKIYYCDKIIANITIMDYAFEYYKSYFNYKVIMCRINRVRMYKGLLLPFELVGIDRMQATNAYYNNNRTSAIKWRFMKNAIESQQTKIINTRMNLKIA